MIKYYIKAFGFIDTWDLVTTCFLKANLLYSMAFSVGLASLTAIVGDVLGFNLGAFLSFLILIVLEWWTGVRVAMKDKKKIQSRKVGRMIIKIGVYMGIVGLLNNLAVNINMPPLFDLDINPLQWIYYVALLYIIFQLLVSLLENWGKLGYNEAGKLSRIFKGKFSSYFEINGEKDNEKFDNNSDT